MDILHDFGILTAVSIVLGLGVTLTLLPAGLLLTGGRPKGISLTGTPTSGPTQSASIPTASSRPRQLVATPSATFPSAAAPAAALAATSR